MLLSRSKLAAIVGNEKMLQQAFVGREKQLETLEISDTDDSSSSSGGLKQSTEEQEKVEKLRELDEKLGITIVDDNSDDDSDVEVVDKPDNENDNIMHRRKRSHVWIAFDESTKHFTLPHPTITDKVCGFIVKSTVFILKLY